jgi:hypothetical protein
MWVLNKFARVNQLIIIEVTGLVIELLKDFPEFLYDARIAVLIRNGRQEVFSKNIMQIT